MDEMTILKDPTLTLDPKLASSLLYSLYGDSQLHMDEPARTFNQRWPLTRDRSGHWSCRRFEALRNMRALPEMMALWSRYHSIEGKKKFDSS